VLGFGMLCGSGEGFFVAKGREVKERGRKQQCGW